MVVAAAVYVVGTHHAEAYIINPCVAFDLQNYEKVVQRFKSKFEQSSSKDQKNYLEAVLGALVDCHNLELSQNKVGSFFPENKGGLRDIENFFSRNARRLSELPEKYGEISYEIYSFLKQFNQTLLDLQYHQYVEATHIGLGVAYGNFSQYENDFLKKLSPYRVRFQQFKNLNFIFGTDIVDLFFVKKLYLVDLAHAASEVIRDQLSEWLKDPNYPRRHMRLVEDLEFLRLSQVVDAEPTVRDEVLTEFFSNTTEPYVLDKHLREAAWITGSETSINFEALYVYHRFMLSPEGARALHGFESHHDQLGLISQMGSFDNLNRYYLYLAEHHDPAVLAVGDLFARAVEPQITRYLKKSRVVLTDREIWNLSKFYANYYKREHDLPLNWLGVSTRSIDDVKFALSASQAKLFQEAFTYERKIRRTCLGFLTSMPKSLRPLRNESP